MIQTNDEVLLNKRTSMSSLSERDFWDDIPDEVKRAVDIAKEELDNGEGIPHRQVMADIKGRFLNK